MQYIRVKYSKWQIANYSCQYCIYPCTFKQRNSGFKITVHGFVSTNTCIGWFLWFFVSTTMLVYVLKFTVFVICALISHYCSIAVLLITCHQPILYELLLISRQLVNMLLFEFSLCSQSWCSDNWIWNRETCKLQSTVCCRSYWSTSARVVQSVVGLVRVRARPADSIRTIHHHVVSIHSRTAGWHWLRSVRCLILFLLLTVSTSLGTALMK